MDLMASAEAMAGEATTIGEQLERRRREVAAR
jgi:hypothetical protein